MQSSLDDREKLLCYLDVQAGGPLRTTLQAVAAQMAGLERLVVHTGDPSGARSVASARDVLEGLAKGGGALPVQDLIAQLVSMGFRWGVSDGN